MANKEELPTSKLDELSLSNLNVNAPEFIPSYLKSQQNTSLGEVKENSQQESKECEDWMNVLDESSVIEVKSDNNDSPSTPSTIIHKRSFESKKEPISIVFCGHVDAGKSTIGGQLMYLTGMIDKRTLEKYEREAKEKNRESWYLSWALDINEEERSKGKTVEVGRAYFETDKRHYIILDAPGHKCFVPNMIGGASQADIAILVVSARKGEFETGFERAGQTREHAMLVKTAGVKRMVVLVNKMDDPTTNWSKERFDSIVEKLNPYLKKCGYQTNRDLMYIPCSGLSGVLLKSRDADVDKVCSWYKGPGLVEYLDTLPQFNRNLDASFRMPIMDRYKDMGTVIFGKIESGTVKLGDKLCMMPNKTQVEVIGVTVETEECDFAMCGENIRLKLKGIDDDQISPGNILCDPDDLCHVGKTFDAQIVLFECKSIICSGYNAVMHLHTGVYEIQVKRIICTVDKKTGQRSKHNVQFIRPDSIAIVRMELTNEVACMEMYNKFPQMGRFTIRDEAKTVAVGKILKIIE
ncbi:hypothetical protein GJ496_005464 [Pomphorhynchus laevis]|nr:hypothetical protein GJ496_005464 [Pomphorhynchus laevis]